MNRSSSRERFIAADADELSSAVGAAINRAYLTPEEQAIRPLAERARLERAQRQAVKERALRLVNAVRGARPTGSGLDALLREYHLASREGVILMCLAEALLRIPDSATADRLIADKIGAGAWARHLGDSDSLLVNASTWGLMLTGRLIDIDRRDVGSVAGWFGQLAGRIGEPVARAALKQAMRIMGHQFVMGRTIGEALERAAAEEQSKSRYSFDMLGEAAITAADAARYFDKYSEAIAAIGRTVRAGEPVRLQPGISVKLSALHCRYEFAQRQRVLRELTPRLATLVERARAVGIGLTVDAEETDRLELSLELIDAILQSNATQGYEGFGLAVQSYQKRSLAVLEWLASRARGLKRRLMVRLVKGAYWDSEVKRAQERGLAGYPVFTRKQNTDVSYLACVRLLAGAADVLYPQIATHNAHTVAYVLELLGHDPEAFEFQRLHGMGEELYTQLVAARGKQYACRVYAPVGAHEDLLPYLVRRLLENGANTSFVNRIVDARLPAAEVVVDPIEQVDQIRPAAHPRILAPIDLYGTERRNSHGINYANGAELAELKKACERAAREPWAAAPVIDGLPRSGPLSPIANPANEASTVGTVIAANEVQVSEALTSAVAAQGAWSERSATERAQILERASDLFEEHRGEFIARCVLEAGKCVPDALSEAREAVDFLRYYAARTRQLMGDAVSLPGPTGERNTLSLRGRGVFACISPWNFPLAIFTGQVSAALATGNAVIAKPAEQTPLTAALAVQLLHAAGVPGPVLQFLPGDGGIVGAALTRDPRVAGVAFTGSTETARMIELALAQRPGPIATLIAETGGINALIADSSALPEQLVPDVMVSGFNSAGQRCSALRLLLVQEEIAPRVLELLTGQLDELAVGDPALLATDVGPVIDRESLQMLESYAAQVTAKARWHHRAKLPRQVGSGRFFAPLAVEIESIEALEREVFGPIVHVVRFRSEELDAVVDAINRKGYGLTLGVHSRLDSVARRIAARARVGNVYVNRSMIGAVVGVQPFGGCGLSGTGPKAGGPHYLPRFTTEQTLTINTAALGGNASLLSL